MDIIGTIRPVAKAVVGFVAPGAVIIASAVLDNSAGGATITQGEWITAAAACLITAAGVYTVRNSAEDTEPV